MSFRIPLYATAKATFLGAFALAVGWGFPAFALPLLATVAVVAGAWVNYERRRRRGVEAEPIRGTWRLRFVVLAVAPLAGLGLLLLL